MIEFIVPEWPAPRHVRALATLRGGGVSHPPYDSLNLAQHVGDEPDCVLENRHRLRAQL
ncbi:MAG: laccase domain-containing protein, partial [Steroidobacteraceae bacterium]